MIRAHQVPAYLRLMRLHRPIGSLLLLWPTLWALWIAGNGRPYPYLVAVFVLGVVLMRSAGCVINDYMDRGFDARVARTRGRPLATGEVSAREALLLFFGLSALALVLVLTLNRQAIALSVVAVLLAVSYPLMKRYTHMPQAYLGVAFGWGIPMAFAAETGRVPMIAWLLLLANIFWTIAYDTAYAMSDRADDLKVGIKSSAILFGRADRLLVGVFHGAAIGLLAWIGWYLHLGLFFGVGLVGAAMLAVYQQYLLRDREPAACLAAFHNNNWFGGCVFLGLFCSYLWR